MNINLDFRNSCGVTRALGYFALHAFVVEEIHNRRMHFAFELKACILIFHPDNLAQRRAYTIDLENHVLSRLGKAMTVGARLNTYYEAHGRQDMGELIEVTRRLETAVLQAEASREKPADSGSMG